MTQVPETYGDSSEPSDFVYVREFTACVEETWDPPAYDTFHQPNDTQIHIAGSGLSCALEVSPLQDVFQGVTRCNEESYDLSVFNYGNGATDSCFRVWIDGGNDYEQSMQIPQSGVWWPGPASGEGWSQALGRQLLGLGNFECILKKPCYLNLDCRQVGSRTAKVLTGEVVQSYWGYFLIASIMNLNQQLANRWQSIGQAAASTALDTFNVDDFYPPPTPDKGFASILFVLGPVLGIFSGVPAFGPEISIASNVVSGFGSYFSNYVINSDDPDLAQKKFAPQAKAIFRQFANALDEAATKLFRGEPLTDTVNGTVNDIRLTDVLKGGAWVNTTALTPVAHLEVQLNIEVTSRSINSLWRTPPHNKMWVLYIFLNDVESNISCVADLSGPQDSKYCADQGAYYTYNFIETTAYLGYVGYPWGGQKLPELGLDLKVRVSRICPSFTG